MAKKILKIDVSGNITRSEFTIDYGYWNNYFWGYGSRNRNAANEAKSAYDECIDDLIYYGKFVGVEEDTIRELLDGGYDYMDIEDMLYNFDYCGEDGFCAEI